MPYRARVTSGLVNFNTDTVIFRPYGKPSYIHVFKSLHPLSPSPLSLRMTTLDYKLERHGRTNYVYSVCCPNNSVNYNCQVIYYLEKTTVGLSRTFTPMPELRSRLGEARRLQETGVEVMKEVLGNRHPDTLPVIHI